MFASDANHMMPGVDQATLPEHRMSLENAQYIHQLNPANPAGSDRLQQGDDHLRMLKAALKATFPNLTGPVTATQDFLNGLAASLVPVGAIALYFGAEAPTGWAICNGQEVPRSSGTGKITTPDLRGRVAVGADDALALGSLTGQTKRTITTGVAGAHTPAATMAPAGGHTHITSVNVASATTGASVGTTVRKVDDGGSASNIVNGVSFTDPGHTHTASATTSEAANHTHALTMAPVPDHAHAATVDVTQPSLALHYIMKI